MVAFSTCWRISVPSISNLAYTQGVLSEVNVQTSNSWVTNFAETKMKTRPLQKDSFTFGHLSTESFSVSPKASCCSRSSRTTGYRSFTATNVRDFPSCHLRCRFPEWFAPLVASLACISFSQWTLFLAAPVRRFPISPVFLKRGCLDRSSRSNSCGLRL